MKFTSFAKPLAAPFTHWCCMQHQSLWALYRHSPRLARRSAVGKRAKLCKGRYLRITAINVEHMKTQLLSTGLGLGKLIQFAVI